MGLMMDEKIRNQIQDILDDIPNEFAVLQKGIDLSLQKEYISFAESVDFNKYSETDVLEESKRLFIKDTSIESKKEILILMAHLGTVEAYRVVEKYLKNSGRDLGMWALLALQECRMFLETYLLEENQGFISTGLGGKGNKLRYCFIISSRTEHLFSRVQKDIIEKIFKSVCKKHESEIEEVDFQDNYFIIKILVPMDIAIGDVIEEGIEECNRIDNIISEHYYVTNVRKPDIKEIHKYLEEINNGEQQKKG